MNDSLAKQQPPLEPEPASAPRRFTLRDLLVAMAVLSLLMAVGLVEIPRAREEARRNSCENNLKQIGIALHNYHAPYLSFPIGSRGAGDVKVDPNATQDHASSWIMSFLDFTEASPIPAEWDHERCNGLTGANMPLVDGFVPDWGRCPSSPLPEVVLIGQHGTPNGRMLPTYVGVAGGVTQPDWKYHDSKRVVAQSGPATGALAGNGTLLVNDCIAIKDIGDGTSNTIMVVEQSDYHRIGSNKQVMVHSAATVGAWCGAKGNGIVGSTATASNPVAWNLTSIRYPVQTKRHQTLPEGMFGPSDTVHLGNNNGIFSAHRGGAYAVFGDGRVRFLDQDTDLEVLVYMSIRDDSVEFEIP